MSPAANVLAHFKNPSAEAPVRILMSGCSDIRHILKTICDINGEEQVQKSKKYSNIEIYFHETNRELLSRCLLFLHLIHETSLNFDERIELFLDLYANAMIKYSCRQLERGMLAICTICERICSTSSTPRRTSPPHSRSSSTSNCSSSKRGTNSAKSYNLGQVSHSLDSENPV
jgi:hypothetical protein